MVSISDAMETSCCALLFDEMDIEEDVLGLAVELDDVLVIEEELEPRTA